jgi:hypothetical protein
MIRGLFKSRKSGSLINRWQDSTSEIEDIGVDRWRVFVNRWSQTLLTISWFWRLKSRESCIQIREIVKSETPNLRKVLLGSQPLLNSSGFNISLFSKIRGQGSLF